MLEFQESVESGRVKIGMQKQKFKIGNSDFLLDGNGLGKVAGMIEVAAAPDSAPFEWTPNIRLLANPFPEIANVGGGDSPRTLGLASIHYRDALICEATFALAHLCGLADSGEIERGPHRGFG